MDTQELKGHALSRAVAEMLVKTGKLRREYMQEWQYDEMQSNGFMYNPRGIWVTLWDGDEESYQLHLNYGTNAEDAFLLTVEGWRLEVHERPASKTWFAQFYNDNHINYATWEGASPSEAISRARLILHALEGV